MFLNIYFILILINHSNYIYIYIVITMYVVYIQYTGTINMRRQLICRLACIFHQTATQLPSVRFFNFWWMLKWLLNMEVFIEGVINGSSNRSLLDLPFLLRLPYLAMEGHIAAYWTCSDHNQRNCNMGLLLKCIY